MCPAVSVGETSALTQECNAFEQIVTMILLVQTPLQLALNGILLPLTTSCGSKMLMFSQEL